MSYRKARKQKNKISKIEYQNRISKKQNVISQGQKIEKIKYQKIEYQKIEYQKNKISKKKNNKTNTII